MKFNFSRHIQETLRKFKLRPGKLDGLDAAQDDVAASDLAAVATQTSAAPSMAAAPVAPTAFTTAECPFCDLQWMLLPSQIIGVGIIRCPNSSCGREFAIERADLKTVKEETSHRLEKLMSALDSPALPTGTPAQRPARSSRASNLDVAYQRSDHAALQVLAQAALAADKNPAPDETFTSYCGRLGLTPSLAAMSAFSGDSNAAWQEKILGVPQKTSFAGLMNQAHSAMLAASPFGQNKRQVVERLPLKKDVEHAQPKAILISHEPRPGYSLIEPVVNNLLR